jgi:hypothetical protein
MHQVYRSYRGRVDRVTDVIRCSIVFATVDELTSFIQVRVCVLCVIYQLKVQFAMRSAGFLNHFARRSTDATATSRVSNHSKSSGLVLQRFRALYCARSGFPGSQSIQCLLRLQALCRRVVFTFFQHATLSLSLIFNLQAIVIWR